VITIDHASLVERARAELHAYLDEIDDRAQIIGWMKIPFDSREISAAIFYFSTWWGGEGHPMDIQERYFVAIAATICFDAVCSCSLSSEPTSLGSRT
jgi:hypothetical protein